ncbi:hypothetical protein VP01_2191g1 [Puccinia sorghi]|uniref:Uncharacterized protein n=1 Tax=Puccinia sorghi TaxID=27349 RepID=A0A0L6V9A0_9BASI|nr:hypothetical protein VP01_2191g1 [Puccinia sorghi]
MRLAEMSSPIRMFSVTYHPVKLAHLYLAYLIKFMFFSLFLKKKYTIPLAIHFQRRNQENQKKRKKKTRKERDNKQTRIKKDIHKILKSQLTVQTKRSIFATISLSLTEELRWWGVSMALECKCYHFTLFNNLQVELKLVVSFVDVKLNNQTDVLPKSSFYHLSNMSKTHMKILLLKLKELFYDLDILFSCYYCIENMNKILASEPPSIFQSKFIRTVKTKIHKTPATELIQFSSMMTSSIPPDAPDHGSFTKPTQLSQPIKNSWLSNKLTVQFMKCLHLEGQPNTLCKPILSFSHKKMNHLCFHSPPSLSLNVPRLLCRVFDFVEDFQPSAQQSVQNQNMLYIIKLIFSLGYFSKHSNLKPIYKIFFVELQRISTLNLGPISPKSGSTCAQLTTKTQQVSSQYMTKFRDSTFIQVPWKHPW